MLGPTPDTTDLHLDLNDRVVAVTGAASGIGAAIAELLLDSGAQVALLDRDIDAASELAERLGRGALPVRCDVTDRASVTAAADAASDAFGTVDSLVNSAGVALLAPAEELSEQFWRTTLEVNLTGTFVACQVFGARMLHQGRGRIVNLASQAASVALDEHVAYCASKFGVLGLTKVLASEWGGRGVTVNTVSPTVVMTALGRKAWDNPAGVALRAKIPVDRFAEPQEIAASVAFLLTQAAAMVNGADLVVDGGYTVR